MPFVSSGAKTSRGSSALWRNADFRNLWAGQTASQFGEQASLITVPLVAVLTLNAGAAQLGVLRAVGQAPLLLLPLLAGAWVDRWRTRTVMMLADLGRFLALSALALAGLLGGLSLPALLAAAFAAGSLSVFFDVGYQASLVRLVDRGQLVQGNSALEGSRASAQIGGAALAGLLVTLLPALIAAAAGAPFFGLSFLSILRIRHESVPQRPQAPVPGSGGRCTRASVSSSATRHCGRCAWRRPPFSSSFAALMTIYLLFLARDLHLAGAAVGLALAATGPGALLGSLLAARLPGRFGYGAVAGVRGGAGRWGHAVGARAGGPAAVTIPALVAVNFVFATFGQLVDVTVMAVRQAVTPAGMQGRAAATITFAGMGLTPVGSLLGGFLGQQCGLRAGLLVTAAGLLLSPAVLALSPLARLGTTLPNQP